MNRRFKPGDHVLIESYPWQPSVGKDLVVKCYDETETTKADGRAVVEPEGFPGWRLWEDSLIPYTARDEERLKMQLHSDPLLSEVTD